MKNLKFKGYDVRCISVKINKADLLSVTLLKNGIFCSGGTLKNKANTQEIKTYCTGLLEQRGKFT